MAWTTPRTWVTAEIVTASIMNTDVRDNLDETVPAIAAIAGQYFVADGANSITVARAETNEVLTSQTTTSTSFTDLTTSGPSVTVTVQSRAMIFVSARVFNNTAGEICLVGVDISGASTVSAADNRALLYESGAANDNLMATWNYMHTGLSAGSTTFKLEYRVTGGTGTFSNRRIVVVPY